MHKPARAPKVLAAALERASSDIKRGWSPVTERSSAAFFNLDSVHQGKPVFFFPLIDPLADTALAAG